ncbi:hypothetical protein AB0941_21890 [Streptomyces sp. NPDC013433]|uniref:hypothetical protein n=2 Tax=unclassified Streptomyces TaxID=2593676 RepID=UPI00345496E6
MAPGLFVDDFGDRVARIAARGLEPVRRETCANGVRKATHRDPDGNESGFGGAPAEAVRPAAARAAGEGHPDRPDRVPLPRRTRGPTS